MQQAEAAGGQRALRGPYHAGVDFALDHLVHHAGPARHQRNAKERFDQPQCMLVMPERIDPR